MFWGDSKSRHSTSRVIKQNAQALAQPPSPLPCTLCLASSLVPGCCLVSYLPACLWHQHCRPSTPPTYAGLATRTATVSDPSRPGNLHSLSPTSQLSRPGPAACWRRVSNMLPPCSSKIGCQPI